FIFDCSLWFTHRAPTYIATLSLHDALPISVENEELGLRSEVRGRGDAGRAQVCLGLLGHEARVARVRLARQWIEHAANDAERRQDRKSKRPNSSHEGNSYAVLFLKKKTEVT